MNIANIQLNIYVSAKRIFNGFYLFVSKKYKKLQGHMRIIKRLGSKL